MCLQRSQAAMEKELRAIETDGSLSVHDKRKSMRACARRHLRQMNDPHLVLVAEDGKVDAAIKGDFCVISTAYEPEYDSRLPPIYFARVWHLIN